MLRKTVLTLTCMSIFINLTSAQTTENKKNMPENLNIVIAGDSTSWGNGLLDDKSFVSAIDDFVKNKLNSTLMPEKMIFKNSKGEVVKPEIYKNVKQYKGLSSVMKGQGASVEFDMQGSELTLCQTIMRTRDWAEMAVYADGKLIGSFNNKNNTLGEGKLSFKADGKKQIFDLDRCFTYNHVVKLNGSELKGGLNTGSYMSNPPFSYFPGYDFLAIRKYNEKQEVVHSIFFKEIPPADTEIEVAFKYGQTITHTACTVGETGKDSEIESVYGNGSVSHDPAKPSFLSSGLDFRYINPKSFFVHKFNSDAVRHIKIEIKDGKNPYFALNFASNRYHNLMNAGVGGWTAALLLNDTGKRSWKSILEAYTPDILFLAFAPNDDWAEGKRFVNEMMKGVKEDDLKNMPSLFLSSAKYGDDGLFNVGKKSAKIESITKNSLCAPVLKGNKDIKEKFFVCIGNYTGDNKSVAVREIKSFDPEKGIISWDKDLSASEILCIDDIKELEGKDFSVRDLGKYKKNISDIVRNMKKVNPSMKIVLVNLPNANYFMRCLWGYKEALSQIASEFPDTSVLDMAPVLQVEQEKGINPGNKKFVFETDSTGAAEYPLPWKGHNQGFNVEVDGKDVYGKDAVVISGALWTLNPALHGGALNFTADDSYNKPSAKTCGMTLRFLKNAPGIGKKIKVTASEKTWSHDFCHPDANGWKIIGGTYSEKISEILKSR